MPAKLAQRVNKIPTGLGSTAAHVLACFAFHADEEGIGHTNLRIIRNQSQLTGLRFVDAVEVLKEDGWIQIYSDGIYEIEMSRIPK